MITKSKYVEFVKCPRCFYYSMNNKDKATPPDEQAKKRIQEGKDINKIAYDLFPKVEKVKEDPDKVDIEAQVTLTKKYLGNAEAIAEASFKFEDLFCAVDILKHVEGNTYDIYEVKGSNNIDDKLKEFCADVGYQKYVLTKCGINVRNCFLVHLNKEYIRHGEIEPKKLLISHPLDSEAEFTRSYGEVEENLKAMRDLIGKKDLPDYGIKCKDDCKFFEFCHSNLPAHNILQLNNIRKKQAHEYIRKGIISFQDIKNSGITLKSQYQRIQVNCELSQDKKPYIDKEGVKSFLDGLKYPLYHLDFETMMDAIPPFDGTHSYQTIPFQYSLHIEESPGGKCIHKEYLGRKLDCERELAEKLCEHIPMNATVIAFHVSTERGIIKYLANKYPDLADHLNNMTLNMVDLLDPFKVPFYYDPKQVGQNSIKYVMPALVPEMEKAYKKLPVVHNGGEALAKFPEMAKMPEGPEKDRIYDGMLKYCELDTLSMVEVLNKLWKVVK